jgi:hypothetical protein
MSLLRAEPKEVFSGCALVEVGCRHVGDSAGSSRRTELPILLGHESKKDNPSTNPSSCYAAEVSGRAQADMETFANELDTFATHDEENARWQHEIADRLDRAIPSETAIRDWHLKMAQRLRDWLAANGG